MHGAPVWGSRPDKLHAYVFCTDAGPEVAYARRTIKRLVEVKTTKGFVFEGNCFKHQLHLVVMFGL